jgi:hypothetical protein
MGLGEFQHEAGFGVNTRAVAGRCNHDDFGFVAQSVIRGREGSSATIGTKVITVGVGVALFVGFENFNAFAGGEASFRRDDFDLNTGGSVVESIGAASGHCGSFERHGAVQ